MNASLLDGKQMAANLLENIRQTSLQLHQQPGLAVIMLGENDASSLYVARKRQVCLEVGFNSFAYDLPANTTEETLLTLIAELNESEEVHGILVQFPLPPQINNQRIVEALSPEKDVDGFHPYNIGRLVQQQPLLRPCTPAGIMHLLQAYEIPLLGKQAVVVGASNIVGRPMALELAMVKATVTLCHSNTQHLSTLIAQADILITAMGKRNIISAEAIKPGAVVVDVAMNRNEHNKLCGDLDFAEAAKRAAWITPVPGGVGPMTIAMLMQNTLQCYWLQNKPS